MGDLDGTGVLITRPAHQAERLAALLAARGARVLRLPALAIEPLPGSPGLRAALDALPGCRAAVFVSANAVEHGLAAVRDRLGRWPAAVAVAAVGRATAAALDAAGVPADIVPAGRSDSEGLLAHPALAQVAGATVVVFRGEGGRELIARELRARGAQVLEAPCYRRVPAAADPAPVLERWRAGEIDIVAITSVDALHALAGLLGAAGRALLAATPAVVISERVATAARKLVAQAVVAGDMSDAGLVEAIVDWRRGRARSGRA